MYKTIIGANYEFELDFSQRLVPNFDLRKKSKPIVHLSRYLVIKSRTKIGIPEIKKNNHVVICSLYIAK